MTEEQFTQLITLLTSIQADNSDHIVVLQTNINLMFTVLIGVIVGYIGAKGMTNPWNK